MTLRYLHRAVIYVATSSKLQDRKTHVIYD